MAQTATASQSDVVHVYQPHRAGLPNMRTYLRDLWARRVFAAEFSKSGIRAANTQTVFGQLWLVLNPLLLALVYFFLVTVLRGQSGGAEFLAHLTGGLFLYFFVTASMTSGASSVTGGGKLILNMSFPRLLMPLAAVRTAFFRFLPTLPVYFIIHVVSGAGFKPAMLLAPLFLFLTVVFAMGMAALLASVQVYFRDTTSFLPYFTRIWLYVSPILWYPAEGAARLGDFAWLMYLNPLYSLIGGWVELSHLGAVPSAGLWIGAILWAGAAFVVGSLFFMSRERDFAVRL